MMTAMSRFDKRRCEECKTRLAGKGSWTSMKRTWCIDCFLKFDAFVDCFIGLLKINPYYKGEQDELHNP